MARGGQLLEDASDHSHGLRCMRHAAQAVASRLTSRRVAVAIASRFTNRRFAFALAVVSVLSAKAVHIHTHVTALSRVHLLRWGYSFFAQDLALLLLIRLLLDNWVFSVVRPVRALATFGASVLLSFVIALGAINVSFFVVSGSEIHWRNIALASDSSSWSMFLSGLFSLALVVCAAFVAGWLLQDAFFALFGVGSDLLRWPAAAILRRTPGINRLSLEANNYDRIPQQDVEYGEKFDPRDGESLFDISSITSELKALNWRRWIKPLLYLFIFGALTAQIILFFIRPHESSLIFMSWTSALLPFVDFSNSSPNLDSMQPFYQSGIGRSWDNRTAVHNVSSPAGIPWSMARTMGFWQRYVPEKHYNAANDPLKISNLKDDVLASLRDKLSNVPIRHVVLIFLESTRKDVFPVKKDGLVWKKLAESFENGTLPEDAQEKLAALTPNANFITGDYNDGFPHPKDQMKRRGGLNFNNAYTPATYTLKSLVGTLCGAPPLIADFNLEVVHKLPAPCIPHILDALNHIDPSKDKRQEKTGRGFLSDKWTSSFMQSVTMDFDSEKGLLEYMGYPRERLISKEYLKGEKGNIPKFGVSDLPDVNYFGIPESPLEDYIRDTFVSAKEKNERVFLTHLTSTSHHPFGLPENETYVPMAQGMDDFSKYVNSLGYDDKWLGKVLGILDEQGVADETLVVMVGDHGLSMPENGLVSAYYNPNVGNLHVPLVVSHPKLPVVDIDDAVTSLQILPTILDLLVETGSLAPEHSRVAKGLAARSYEGQTMIRELRKSSSKTGQGDWQFTVINPGRAMVSVRDARQPHLRLVVPVIDNIEWRFTDLSSDPTEEAPVQGFEFLSFLHNVERTHGVEMAKWVEEAAFISRWWVEDNSKRWRYGPYRDYLP
ncbi:sulfatase domain-containing protein [Pochonia chlamydosporia 170]|uniref:Sulfatase domain-containing protein n=1 Tax=Pochonia chlamydosporia 170 TaxID=1380566 RepID=A0A179G1R5_METCM|nr:sulfatase domain-containing protein [Pochonia chlamydosporia 170]OAQ71281.1 sulfatase domain-containing protein [Pochonia chlamydosporia 170]